jgi:hypothetical protein
MADNQRDALGSHSHKTLDEADIVEFSSRLRRKLIRPQDSGYDEARSVFYGGI